MQFDTLASLREHHPAWRLLAAQHAPMIASFLHRVFVAPNVRAMHEADLAEALEDELFTLRERLGPDAFPKSARDYLKEWSAADRGWLRSYYKPGTDDRQYDLTPATEKALAWLASLTDRPFVGTESRLLTLFTLLEQISAGTEADPAKRADELRRKRRELDEQIARAEAGEVPMLDDTAVKDRFLQFQQLARELLADFREVEDNFRQLDRAVREKIARWDGAKGALLDEIMGQRDAIGDSDQGRSFRAFWEFLMSSRRQDELEHHLERTLALPPVAALAPDARTRRIHDDWLKAGEHTQRTVARLSQQLRRFLDDRSYQEQRRTMDLLRGLETVALAVREAPPTVSVMSIDDLHADVPLPMERPLFSPATRVRLAPVDVQAGADDVDTSQLFGQIVVDKERLRETIARALRQSAQVTLREVLESAPLHHGLAELVAYLEIAHDDSMGDAPSRVRSVVDDRVEEPIRWEATTPAGHAITREARLPRVIFMR
jgi:flagellar motility protein MotE (MotC chaperone)